MPLMDPTELRKMAAEHLESARRARQRAAAGPANLTTSEIGLAEQWETLAEKLIALAEQIEANAEPVPLRKQEVPPTGTGSPTL
jgi:hypothetical protein